MLDRDKVDIYEQIAEVFFFNLVEICLYFM